LKKRIKYKPIVISAVILTVIVYLIYTGLRDTMVFYLTVSEVMAKPLEELTDTQKVGGIVTAGSVKWDPRTLKLSFKLEDQKANLIVNYSGVVLFRRCPRLIQARHGGNRRGDLSGRWQFLGDDNHAQVCLKIRIRSAHSEELDGHELRALYRGQRII
jgi:hypothetical protein